MICLFFCSQSTLKPTFIQWYKVHKDELMAEKPDITPVELTKYGMNKYKLLYPVEEKASGDDTPKETSSAAKRKLTEGQSGIAKLARFNFNK